MILGHGRRRYPTRRLGRDLGGATDLLATSLREFRRRVAVEQHLLIGIGLAAEHRRDGRIALGRAKRQIDDAQRGHLWRPRDRQPLLHQGHALLVDEAEDKLAFTANCDFHVALPFRTRRSRRNTRATKRAVSSPWRRANSRSYRNRGRAAARRPR